MKLRTKLWVLMLFSIVGSFLLFIILSLQLGKIWNNGYSLNSLNAISEESLTSIKENGAFDKESIKTVLDEIHQKHPSLRFEVVSFDGSVLYDTSGETSYYTFEQLADRFINMPENLWAENQSISLAYSINDSNPSYYLLLSLPSEAMQQGQLYFFVRTDSALIFTLVPMLIFFMVPYLLSIGFFSSVNRRISKLNEALNQVGIESNTISLNDKSKDEIGQLIQHFNLMVQRIHGQASQIKQLENKRKQLLSNLSHDLRTPLTMILGHAETIRTGVYQNEKELQTSAKIILQRSRYMDKLLDQLLDITRQDIEAFKPYLEPNNLSEKLRKTLAEYSLFLDDSDFTIEIDIPDEDVIATIDAPLLDRAVRNLLDNAIRYGKEGHFLGIELKEKPDEVWITVKDKGRGIPIEHQQHIFERFYRVDEGRGGDRLGIGLSIVKDIVDLHQGEVQLKSIPFKETTFLIKLPQTKHNI